MKRSKLEKYLSDPQLAKKLPVSEEELWTLGPEPLLSVYTIIRQAIREDTPIIEVTAQETLQRNKLNGSVINRGSNLTDLRSHFELIRERDAVIKSCLHVVTKTDNSVIYQVFI